MQSKKRVIVLQRVCTNYRIPLFKKLSEATDLDFKLLIGADIPKSKVRNSKSLDGVSHEQLATIFIRLFKWIFPYHIGLIRRLKNFKPDVIICEAESHFLGYLKAIIYKYLFNNNVKLVYWCYIQIPGQSNCKSGFRSLVKKFFRSRFSAFLLYSSYGANVLVSEGYDKENIFIAVNVGDVELFLGKFDEISLSKEDMRETLGLPNRFTILYSGTLDNNKKPNLILDLAANLNNDMFNFILVGTGEMETELRSRTIREKLSNVYLLGRLDSEIFNYYRASDLLVVPGRGGIVISEAMCFRIPVLIYQGDGTEYDLVKDNKTGWILNTSDLSCFQSVIVDISADKEKLAEMGIESQKMVRDTYNTESMVKKIIELVNYLN